VVPPGDAIALSQTLACALGDPARLERMGRAGRAWYERERQAEGRTLLQLYERLASGHQRDRSGRLL
jgi:hypothetical protein